MKFKWLTCCPGMGGEEKNNKGESKNSSINGSGSQLGQNNGGKICIHISFRSMYNINKFI